MSRPALPMTTTIRRCVVFLAAFALACAACAQSAPNVMRPHPSDKEAREDLSRLVAIAQTGGVFTLCEHGTANCEKNARDTDAMGSVPTSEPLVVGSRDIPDGDHDQGGRALKICGLDGIGRAYRTEILIFGTPDDFTVIEAVYWIIGIADAEMVAPTSSTPGAEWSACPAGATD